MPTSREKQRQQSSEDTEHVLHELWSIRPSTLFYNSLKRNFERDMNGAFDIHLTCTDDEIIEDFKASESELRKMRTLCFYSCHFFCENGNNTY